MHNFFSNISDRTVTNARRSLLILLLMGMINMSFAQAGSREIVVPQDNLTVHQLFEIVKKETNLRFAYDHLLDLNREVEISAGKVTVEYLMSAILKNTNRNYSIVNNVIAIQSPARSAVTVQARKGTSDKDNYAIDRAAKKILLGRVVDAQTLLPLSDAVVELLDCSKELVTNNKGEFHCDELEVGQDTLRIRCSEYMVTYYKISIGEGQDTVRVLIDMHRIKTISDAELIRADIPVAESLFGGCDDMRLMAVGVWEKRRVARYAIKTNLIYAAMATINLGFEMRLSDRVTLDLPVSYNPWTISTTKKRKHFLVQPEVRFWTKESFGGHFVGAHLHYSHFNIAGIKMPFVSSSKMKEHRYQGDLYGLGVSYGYHYPFSYRWRAEATVGVGYSYMNYRKYDCPECGDFLSNERKHYFGPTKLGLSLIFMIK